jgi:hypothetical protein
MDRKACGAKGWISLLLARKKVGKPTFFGFRKLQLVVGNRFPWIISKVLAVFFIQKMNSSVMEYLVELMAL